MAAALEASNDLICTLDLQARFTSWNVGCERLYGWKAEEVIGQPVEMYVPESEQGRLALILHAVRNGEDVPPVETTRLTRDGRLIHVSLRISALRDETGAVIGGVAVDRDITLEVSCRREVEEARSHLRARLDHTDVAHATLTSAGTYSYANEAYCRLLGRPHGAVIDQPVLTFASPEDRARDVALLREFAAGSRERVAEHRRLRRPDGSTVDVIVHVSTIRTPEGDISGVAVTLQDVTDLQRANARLSAVRARWSALSRHAVDVGFLAAPDGTLNSVSEALGERFGYTRSQVLGRRCWDFFHPDDVQQVRVEWDRVASGQVDRTCFEARIRHADGTWRWIEENVVDLRGDSAVGSLVATVHDISARKLAEERLGELSLYDQLTGLPNRALLLDRTHHALERSRQSDSECALLLVGLDDFALVNDQLGHAAGDEVLVAVSQLLGAVLSPVDTVARVEADRFAVLIESVHGLPEVEERARALQSLLSVGVGARDRSAQIGAGIGAVFGWRSDAAAMLAAAERALRAAKAEGAGQIEVFTERARAAAQSRREAVGDLRRGIAADELVLHYQPVIELETGAPVGVEALVRWQHPERGLLPPADFLELAEETGLILELGEAVLRTACRAAAGWPDRGSRPLTVAINLSLRQLAEPDVVDLVRQALSEASLDPARVILEVTETAVTHDVATMTETLLALRALGVEVAMDDFGTGYSSLTYLRQFPVTAVKIDRSFVSGLGVDADDDAIVGSVVSLATAVGLDAIAEGVESPHQRDRLLEMGCRYGQGFLWSRPLPERDLLAWLSRQPTAPAASVRPERAPRGPEAAAAVGHRGTASRRISELLAQGASLHTIAAALNAGQIATATGVRWHPRSVARAITEDTGQQ